jgi:SAM-dependent methyltransferase
MPAPEQVLYAMPAMRALLRAESAAVCAKVPPRAGSYGLRMGMQDTMGGCPDAVAHWVRLHASAGCWIGDVHAAVREPLPFVQDAFALVWLSQVLQFHADAADLLHEAARVTAPGGLLVLSGMHPASTWAPWLTWCMRGTGSRMHLRTPLSWAPVLERAGLDVRDVMRFGQILPRSAKPGRGSPLLGGGYLLVAQKRDNAVTPLRDVCRVRRSRLQGTLAPGAHRECA